MSSDKKTDDKKVIENKKNEHPICVYCGSPGICSVNYRLVTTWQVSSIQMGFCIAHKIEGKVMMTGFIAHYLFEAEWLDQCPRK